MNSEMRNLFGDEIYLQLQTAFAKHAGQKFNIGLWIWNIASGPLLFEAH